MLLPVSSLLSTTLSLALAQTTRSFSDFVILGFSHYKCHGNLRPLHRIIFKNNPKTTGDEFFKCVLSITYYPHPLNRVQESKTMKVLVKSGHSMNIIVANYKADKSFANISFIAKVVLNRWSVICEIIKKMNNHTFKKPPSALH